LAEDRIDMRSSAMSALLCLLEEILVNYQVYFDFRQSSIDWLSFWPGVVLIIFTFLWLITSAKSRKRIISAVLLLVFEILILLFFIFVSYDQFAYYTNKFNNNDYAVIEGTISDHVPVTRGNGGRESFEVNNVKFEFQGKGRPPIFNQTVAKGGKIRDGLQVKIFYTSLYGYVPGWAILRIEVKQ
jgi:hypothetical protein